MSNVAVLLATYNGEKFLGEQLQSILYQNYKDFVIYIHDDGSNDNTLKIIENYYREYKHQIVLLKDDNPGRGAKNSFFWLLAHVEADYYFFCDQDDVWFPNKIKDSLDKIKQLEYLNPNKPIMVHTDLELVDENLNQIWASFWNWAKFNVDLNKHFCFTPFGNVFTGCTMVFNRLVKERAFPIPDFVTMHDRWIGLVAAKYGVVENIKKATLKYRQHGKNVCSIGIKKHFKLFDIFKSSGWYNQEKELLKYIEYGSKLKAVICKTVYSILRRLYHN